jgi:hypothetical protein
VLNFRLARPADRNTLRDFGCSSADPRLESFVRYDALDLLEWSGLDDDVRLLLGFDSHSVLAAVALHRRNFRLLSAGSVIPGSELVLICVNDDFRFGRLGHSDALSETLEAAFADIRSRDRGDLVALLVHEANSGGRRIVERLQARHVGKDGDDDVFVVFLE